MIKLQEQLQLQTASGLHLSPMLFVGQQPTTLYSQNIVRKSLFFWGRAEQSKNEPNKMTVIDSKSISDQEIIDLFSEIKMHFNRAIKDEKEKAFLIFVSDFCCQDLINKRGNPITNRKEKRDENEN